MNPRQLSLIPVALARTSVLGACIVGWIGSFGSAAVETTGATAIADISVPASSSPSETTATGHRYGRLIEMAMANVSATNIVTTNPRAANKAAAPVIEDIASFEMLPADAPIVQAAMAAPSEIPPPDAPPVQVALASPSEMLLPETPSVQTDIANTPEQEASETREAVKEAVSSLEIVDECLVVEPCIDRYLWALYQRTPKEDTIKERDQRKVAVKRKGKTVMVTRTFTKLVDQDFTWKDPKAADRSGMSMMDYVIGGMDRSFKLKLYHVLHAAEAAGLSPGITSAFRDDYRQSIASGLKAASNRSYHGGSLRGGYGHGLAADIVSVDGRNRAQRWVSTEKLWKWVDANGKAYGIGRPYLDRDPPHVGPIDGQEYASRRGGAKVAHATADAKKTKRVTARDHRAPAKPAKAAGLSKVKTS
ncbi:peptidase M15 [Bradyrhizobium manausense]|uniref:peptidase M15 n=1 Tax=Bradyrhizobium TaxID=374 RepID=UPI001BAD428A|nr:MULTISPECIES: peptidase M15 [Bradyrhizobium]MBR0829248.1 peptidase M15 [Bradyrhizobium manausense]UVO33054.1 peptidase M15 [Bradyrhizobium arachidis]